MFKIITKPNLPESPVKHCLIGAKYHQEIDELKDLNIECLCLEANNNLYDEINSHADILSFNIGNGKIIISEGSIGEAKLTNLGYSVFFENNIKSPYPNDILLNAALIDNLIICKTNCISDFITDCAKQNNLEIINTKQGYSRCNICIVAENAVITEDDSIAYLLKKCQFDVLKISNGSVFLSEQHSGFLGGASAKLAKDKIYFSGDLSKHKDFDLITEFLNLHKVTPIYNKNRNLRDFGGLIQLTELIKP